MPNTVYFSDIECGQAARNLVIVDARVWGGLHTLIVNRIADGSFGLRYPDQCVEGQGPCGCDEQAFGRALAAEVRALSWPLDADDLPATPLIMDLLHFCAKAAGKPISLKYHSYQNHHHLRWDQEAGLQSFAEDVNLIFARNGLAYEITPQGDARRLLSEPLASALSRSRFATGDRETDAFLEAARHRIVSPHSEDRHDALEKLWDAFERLKTHETGADKKAQAEAMLDRAAPYGSDFRTALGEEAMKLTAIGNAFRIRHSERNQESLTDTRHVDYLFARMFAFIDLMLKAGRGD